MFVGSYRLDWILDSSRGLCGISRKSRCGLPAEHSCFEYDNGSASVRRPCCASETSRPKLGGIEPSRDGRTRTRKRFTSARKSIAGVNVSFRLRDGKVFRKPRDLTFFPRVEIIFAIEKTDEHYHVPLLISPYGYSTYRGS